MVTEAEQSQAARSIGWLEKHFERDAKEEHRADGLKHVETVYTVFKKQSSENLVYGMQEQERNDEIIRLKNQMQKSKDEVFGTGGRKWQDFVELQTDENGTCFVLVKPQDLSDEFIVGSAYRVDGEAIVEIKENTTIPLLYWTAILKCLQENAHRLPVISEL